MKKISYSFALIYLLLSITSCTTSESAIQTAMANTQAAMPTSTDTPEPTATFTLEPSPTNTNTPTVIPSPTPDLRVIIIDSKEFLLEKDDLPANAKYYLPNAGWISPHHNSEIISGWGKEEGLEYLERTGRIDGWFAYYKRGSSAVKAPEEIYHNIIQYKTGEGAFLTVTEFSTAARNPDWAILDDDFSLGDKSIICIFKEMQPGGEYRVWYRIETAYRNYVSIVAGYGWEKEFDLDYVTMVAELMVDKLSEAPLGDW